MSIFCLSVCIFAFNYGLVFFHRICAEMAELSTNAREYEKAINFYKEGLTYDETHIPVSVNMLQLDSLVSKAALQWSTSGVKNMAL